jgi:hypothetical protein
MYEALPASMVFPVEHLAGLHSYDNFPGVVMLLMK